jgi:hypothetical protein
MIRKSLVAVAALAGLIVSSGTETAQAQGYVVGYPAPAAVYYQPTAYYVARPVYPAPAYYYPAPVVVQPPVVYPAPVIAPPLAWRGGYTRYRVFPHHVRVVRRGW